MKRFQTISLSFSRIQTIIVMLGIISLVGVGLIGCQTQETGRTPTTPAATPSAPPMPTTSTVPVTPAPPTPPLTPTPLPTENVTAPPPVVTQPAPQPILPTFISVTANTQSTELARVTAVFRFDSTNQPGYYSISLLSGSDNFGAQQVEWYRATKQIEVIWSVPAGRQAYYRLKNDEPVSAIFQTQVSYKKFVSLNTVPRDTPSELEREIVDYVNRERTSRGLSLLAWDDSLYKQALPRLKAIGEEGVILPPPVGQAFSETAYVSTGGIGQDAITIYRFWTTDPNYFNVITSPGITSLAIRTDTYDNHKFYAIGLFK